MRTMRVWVGGALTLMGGALISALLIKLQPVAPVPAVCTGDVVIKYWDRPVGCDVVPPQRLDVILPADAVSECRDMSGTPIPMVDGRLYCRGVDY